MCSANMKNIVISGLAGSFPKSDNVEEFMDKLFSKENLLQDVPNMPCKLGKMKNLDKFDNEFFDFNHVHRVNVMDPMARIVMEKAYEALIDSGTNPANLKGKSCGVYIGIHFLETEALVYEKIQKGASLAISRSFNANRISYWLGVHGPSYIVDSACSSTLLALEMGFKAIRGGECESALIGGCHVCLHPALLLHLLKIGALNPKGESRVFDENAGGFCKAETIGMFYLQKATDAKRIYAEVINVRSNHDGSKPLFLTPHGPSQMKLLKTLYSESKVDPDAVAWIEAHATGTLVGDKQEVTAIDETFSERTTPLLIGSVKSNMGHAEAAAGVSSLTKVIIAMETGFIPPNINITNVRKDIEAFKSGRIKVVTEKTPWNGGIVGISGFGMGGSNTHVILKSFTKEKINHGIPEDNLPRIVGVSGRTEEAVEVLLNYLEMTSIDAELISLLHQIHNENIRGHPYRGYVILHKNENCIIKRLEEVKPPRGGVSFVYTNYLSDWCNIYRSLTDVEIFQKTIDRCSNALSQFGVNLVDILDNCSTVNSLFDGFIAAVTIQLGLTDLMKSVKIEPDYIMGFSLGELLCAYADGHLSLEETITSAYYCAAFLSIKLANTNEVVTVVIDKEFAELRSLVPRHLTFTFPSIVTGPTNDVALFLTFNRLQSTNVLNATLPTPSISDAGKLQEILRQTMQSKRKSNKWLCSRAVSENFDLSEYLVNVLCGSVNVESTCGNIPGPVLAVEFLGTKFFNILNDLRGESGRITLANELTTVNITDFLSTLGVLYLSGSNPNFDRLYPVIRYPVSRGTKMISPLVKWKHTTSWPVAFSNMQERLLSGQRKVSVALDEKEHSYISGHEIDLSVLYPGTGYLVLAWETLASIYGRDCSNTSVIFEHVRFHKAVVLPDSEPIVFNVMVQAGNGDFEIMHDGEVVANGRVYLPRNIEKEKMTLKEPVADEIVLDGLDFYRYILIRGYNYKGLFRSISQINSQGTRAEVQWNRNWVTYLDGVLQLNMLNDKCVSLCVPVEIEKLVVDIDKHNESLVTNVKEIEAIMDKDLNIIESGGVQVRGCVFRPIPPKLVNKVPLVQKYLFTPFIGAEEVSTKQAVYLFMQIIMDYYGQRSLLVKLAEIVDDDLSSPKLLLSPLFSNFHKEQPIFRAEIKVYHNNDADYRSSKNDLINIFGKLPLDEKVHVIACGCAFKENKLKRICCSLRENGFLIARQALSEEIVVPNAWYVCCDVLTKGGRLLLLKKKPESKPKLLKAIKVSSATFEWIEELQETLKLKMYEKIVLYAENEPYSGLLGFFNCLRLEKGTENVRCYLFLDDTESLSLENEFCRSQIAKDLPINVYKDGKWGCYIRQPVGMAACVKAHHAFLNTKSDGRKQNLIWWEGPINASSWPNDENLMHVYYGTVNTTDILVYKNRLAREALLKDAIHNEYIFGREFSGRSTSGVRFMGLLSHGCLSTLIKLQPEDVFIHQVPNNWSLEDAATVPSAYYVAIYALVVCGKLQLGNKTSVLIHSAGSVVGQAAIIVASYYRCEIFVTVDSVDEKIFVKENFPFIADSMVFTSSDTSFEHIILQVTARKGVDVVLNTVSQNKLNATVNCLARGGKLIQIKKIDLRNSNLNVNQLLTKNISMYSALLEDIFKMNLDERNHLKNVVDGHIKTSAVKPLIRTVYCYTGIESAFEFASFSKNLGKCIVQIEPEEEELKVKPQLKLKDACPRFMCKPDCTYIVCGGLGGMGMELVNWLVQRGAGKVVISSLRGISRSSQKLRINLWKSKGVQLIISVADISKNEDAVKLLEEANTLGGVAGIFNLAGVLHDKTFENQTAENFRLCAAPKLHGTFNLDRISRIQCPQLEQFVVFSSIASGYGNFGQTNYGMFNSSVERICEQRVESNLPALAIQWGAVGDVGMFVAYMDGNVKKSYAGCYMQPIKSCLEVLDRCLCQRNSIVASLVVEEKHKQKQ